MVILDARSGDALLTSDALSFKPVGSIDDMEFLCYIAVASIDEPYRLINRSFILVRAQQACVGASGCIWLWPCWETHFCVSHGD